MPRVRRRELQARLAVRRGGPPADAPRGRGRAGLAGRGARARSSARATTWPSRTTSACACSRCRTGWTRIGRSLSAHVRFDDPTVSRRHALLYRDEAGARILDDRSLNGVFRNGDRVELAELEDGDEISIGRFSLFFVSLVGARGRRACSSARPCLARLDGPVAELALGARDVDRALLRGDPDREAGERRGAGPPQQAPEPLARRRGRARHAGGHRLVGGLDALRGEHAP